MKEVKANMHTATDNYHILRQRQAAEKKRGASANGKNAFAPTLSWVVFSDIRARHCLQHVA